ncbi:MAG: transglutaminase family protein [Gemmatimonadales bacterium]
MIPPGPPSTEYLEPTAFIDSDHPEVRDFARAATADESGDIDRAVALYYAVRDGIRYDPYRIDLSPNAMTASAVLRRGYGFCVPKAILLAAGARALGIPSRLGFADVKNHLVTTKLRAAMQTDLFAYHGYAELFLEGRWVKATPAFNASLCERFGVEPLDFDGRHDSMLQQFDRRGNRYIQYVRDHGQFADLPLERIRAAFHEHYPALMTARGYSLSGSFEEDGGAHP